MTGTLSDICKKKIKELEGKLVWSIKGIKESPFPFGITSDYLTFMALSFRHASQAVDAPCKKVLTGYEDDILRLSIREPTERIEELEAIALRLRAESE